MVRLFFKILLLVVVAGEGILLAQEETKISVSPKSPWGDFTVTEDKGGQTPVWLHIVLWAPNRVLDFFDIFRADIGVGSQIGGVVRLSKYAQLGYREPLPASVRVGLMGRRLPVRVERDKEFGIGPSFKNSRDRAVCPAEFGVGADAWLLGIYGGLCMDEFFDFIAGIFFLDPAKDDIM